MFTKIQKQVQERFAAIATKKTQADKAAQKAFLKGLLEKKKIESLESLSEAQIAALGE